MTDGYDQVADLLGASYHVFHQAGRHADGTGLSIASRWEVGEVWEETLRVTPRADLSAIAVAEILAPGALGTLLFIHHNASWQLGFERELQAVAASRLVEDLLGKREQSHGELGYGQLLTASTVEIEGKSYPISHAWQHTPIHLVGFRTGLDKRTPGVAGAARISPHGLVQEFLNRSEGNLWGFLSDGLRLGILRDNASLTRQAYVEFDLEAMMDGEVYPDFVLLWLLCHQSRVKAERPEECYLEKWSHAASEQGTRALEGLRDGVEQAIASLGSGFLSHRAGRHHADELLLSVPEALQWRPQGLRPHSQLPGGGAGGGSLERGLRPPLRPRAPAPPA